MNAVELTHGDEKSKSEPVPVVHQSSSIAHPLATRDWLVKFTQSLPVTTPYWSVL